MRVSILDAEPSLYFSSRKGDSVSLKANTAFFRSIISG